jgi:predicted membrane-bound spermidine synthase
MSDVKRAAPYLLFAASGLGGLVDQVIWVRQFAKLFGNTIYSSAIVTSVFMCGLGAGSWIVGRRADSRHRDPVASLRAYAWAELAIAAIVVVLALLTPAFSGLSLRIASYSRDASDGFYQLSFGTRVLQYAFAVVALGPPTFLMGGTLTLLIRYVVGSEVSSAGMRVGALYGLNTAGAALGALLTDFLFVPKTGIFATQLIAAGASALAGGGALLLARTHGAAATPLVDASDVKSTTDDENDTLAMRALVALLFVSGVAALGFEIFWFRFLSGILGAYRSVFSILLAVLLVAIWLGAVAAGAIERRVKRPTLLLIASQGLLVLTAGVLLSWFDKDAIVSSQLMKIHDSFASSSELHRAMTSLWLVARPTLFLTALPAFFMGATFPLANAIAQRNAKTVGTRAGALYFANTAGNVIGSLVVGFVLLPGLGVQGTATTLVFIAAASFVLSVVVARAHLNEHLPTRLTAAAGALGAIFGVAMTASIMNNGLLKPSLVQGEGLTMRIVDVNEGVNETVVVAEVPGVERALLTNGFSMSRTGLRAQRYMRAFAHVPLLQMDAPERVLVICFGVGNTTHAASLHPIKSLEVADLSRDILHESKMFPDNHDVLHDPRTSVFVNDGRHHLMMQKESTYDLITLEPPPIGFAGVASLYSRDFYALARTRLKPGGYLTQWLPGYQVGGDAMLALVRAFIDVFPQSVLLSGEGRELVMMGTTGDTIATDVEPVLARLKQRPAVLADLDHVQMGALTELFGTFVASNETMRKATQNVSPVTDDKPSVEYSQLSGIRATRQPKELFDVSGLGAWCRDCIVNGEANKSTKRLPDYLRILGSLYSNDAFLESGAFNRQVEGFDIPTDDASALAIEKSPYLRSIFHGDIERELGEEHLRRGEIDEAIGALRRAEFLHPGSDATAQLLHAALAAQKRAQTAPHPP